MKSHAPLIQRTRRCAWCEKRIRHRDFTLLKQLEVDTLYPPRFWENSGRNGPVKLSAGADVCRRHATMAETLANLEAYR